MYADVAHPVERHLPKVDVAGSSPVIRSSCVLAVFDCGHAFFFRQSVLAGLKGAAVDQGAVRAASRAEAVVPKENL